MSSGPTRGAIEFEDRRWQRRPAVAFGIRCVAHLLPVLVGVLAVRASGGLYLSGPGGLGILLWLVQAIAVAAAAAGLAERAAIRLLPLARFFDLTLVFPDRAPSRFGAALRRNTASRLRARATSGDDPAPGAAEAAEGALHLVAELARHDRRTRGHTERVRGYAGLIAEELGLSDEDQYRLAWGALLHDVGKLHVPAEILDKTDPLTDAEWSVLRDHPALGHRFIEPLQQWLGPWALAASEHHERWDGKGYPLGLHGEEISLAGRIVAVADTYDVITSRRSYKTPLSPEAAREELVRCAGSQFDPAVVRAMLRASLGRRWRTGGIFGPLGDLPVLGQLGSAAGGAAVAGATALAVTVAAVSGVLPGLDGIADAGATPNAAVTVAEPTTSTPATPDDAPSLRSGEVTDDPTSSTPPSPDPTVTTPGPTTTTQPGATTTTAGRSSTTSTTSTSPTPTPGGGTPTTTTPTPDAGSSTTTTPTTTTTTTATPTTTTTTAATPTTTTTTTEPPTMLRWVLTNPGSGATASSAELPLSTGTPDAGPLPNYDTDRDSAPGLMVAKDGAGLGTGDLTKRQDWVWAASSTTPLDGTTSLTLDVGAKDLKGGERIGVVAGLYVCDPTCTLRTSATWSTTSSAGAYTAAVLDLGSLDESLSAGDELVLRVVVPDSSSDVDVFLAYDTPTHTSELRVGSG